MISVKNIRIPANWVLTKIDPDHTSYQFGGRETGILAPNYEYKDGNRVSTPQKNFATTGTVYGVPEKIRFTREAIKKIKASIVTERNGEQVMADASLLYKINALKEYGCRFETENELQIGDRIKFSYQVHLKAQYFDTDEGEMCFIKYDDIYMTVDGKMVNGCILVDPTTQDVNKEGAMTYVTTASGILLPKLGEAYKRSARWMHGTVLHVGKKIGGYFDFAEYCDDDINVKEGDKLIFDPRTAVELEMNTHRQLADRKLLIIQRKDILFMEKENSQYEKLCTI